MRRERLSERVAEEVAGKGCGAGVWWELVRMFVSIGQEKGSGRRWDMGGWVDRWVGAGERRGQSVRERGGGVVTYGDLSVEAAHGIPASDALHDLPNGPIV